ncbi:Cadherin domain containing protein [Aphelenchoides avenae]|nr:Cadherin domain containing protein [Aphelenchus avenae]
MGAKNLWVLALDGDAEDKLEYSLVTTGPVNPSHYFDINPQYGVITLTRSLSTLTDLSGDEIAFAVRVTDNGNPPHQRQIPMRIRVVQPPANVPHFSRLHYLFAMEEDADMDALVGQLQGNELTQTLRNVRFSIASEHAAKSLPFTIDTHTGKITVTQPLDRETRAQYNFVVRISSSGSGGGDALHSFALVTIGVLDVNDNAPKFETVYKKITVPEDALAGSIVAILLATDPDEGRNSRVFYGLDADATLNNAFTVDREYGWLMVGKGGLDREERSSYQLKVMASDESGRNSTMTIRVDVGDVNDSQPRFNQTQYESTVDASKLQVGQLLVAVNLTDPDTIDKDKLNLFVVHGSDSAPFAVNGTDGIVLKRLPTGSRTRYELTLVGSDGIHSVNSTAVITLVNASSSANEACHSPAHDLKIPGNLAPGHVILRFSDDFPIRELRVRHLIDANQMPFSIHNNTLTVDESYYAKKEYSLRIRVQRERLSDGQKLSSCIEELHLSVENANRNRPLFHQNFTVTIPENTIASEEQSHFVLRAAAEDDDIGEFGAHALRYEMVGHHTVAQLFAINEVTGVVSLRKPLDHESQKEHRFQVIAKDGGGLSAKASIVVHVEDINDNAPAFAQPVYRLKVLEDEAVGYELLKLHANDRDANAHITYSFAPGSEKAQKYITLRPDGTLVLAHRIDYENIRELSFKMLATDDGAPPLTGSALVELSVLDVNDSPPKFERRLYDAEVLARDADSEHFGKVSYTLSGDDSSFFTITDDGWLLLAKPADYEKTKLLEVNIKAADGGTPPLSDDTLVRVTVIDENDNPPQFAVCNMSALVQEGILPGQTLLTVLISDEDGAANGPPFRLELAGKGASAFAFDPHHNLVTTKQMSYAESKEYFLMATAHDVHGLSSSCPLHIYVKQQSVHPPEVRPLIVTLNTLHGEYLGGEIGRVEATDKDPSDMLRYAIVDPYTPNSAVAAPFSPSALKFTVEPETGVIRAQPDILPGLHRFNVSVTDGRYIVHAPVTVDISNIDQRIPNVLL